MMPGTAKRGPQIFGGYPLRNFGFNLAFNLGSGTPYTRNALPNRADVQFGVNSNSQVDGTVFGSRLPFNFRFDLRVDKEFYFTLGGRRTGDGTDGASAPEQTIRQNSRERQFSLNVYLLMLNMLNRANVLGVYAFSGLPDNAGFLETPQGQVVIDSEGGNGDEQAFVDQWRAREKNPNNFSQPLRLRLGVNFSF
jgi:hypothetical protein